MRITLPSGTPAEIDTSVANPKMGLVIAPDIFGLRQLFSDLVSRLANEWQMAVIAVEPFPGKELSADVNERFAEMAKLDDSVHLRDLTEAADALSVDRVGLIGFCMGGMYCFKAALNERFVRIASFYGMIVMPPAWKGPGHVEPLACLINGYADNVLAILGGEDPYTPEADIAQLRATGAQIAFYPDANHAFAHDASRPSYRKNDADDAYAKTKDWLLSALR